MYVCDGMRRKDIQTDVDNLRTRKREAKENVARKRRMLSSIHGVNTYPFCIMLLLSLFYSILFSLSSFFCVALCERYLCSFRYLAAIR